MPQTIALISHDCRKEDMVRFVVRNRKTLARFRLIATRGTGTLIQARTGLGVETKHSGPLGGDAQIAAEVVGGSVLLVVFLLDPLTAHPHDPDVQMLIRLCNVHDVALATNVSSADLLTHALQLAPREQSRVLREELHPPS